MAETKTATFYIDAETDANIDRLAENMRRSRSGVLRELVANAINASTVTVSYPVEGGDYINRSALMSDDGKRILIVQHADGKLETDETHNGISMSEAAERG